MIRAAGARRPRVGTGAALAAANPIPAPGQLAYASDLRQGAIGDGATAWNALPKFSCLPPGLPQAAYTETSLLSVANVATDWPGLSVTFTSDGVTPFEVVAFCSSCQATDVNVTVGTTGALMIVEGAAVAGEAISAGAAVAGVAARMGSLVAMTEPRVFSAGAHTLKVQGVRASGAGLLTFLAFSPSPLLRAFIRARPVFLP